MVQETTFQMISYMKEVKFTTLKLSCALITDMLSTLCTFDENEGKHGEKEKKGEESNLMVCYFRSLTSQRAAGGQAWEARERSCHRSGYKEDRQTRNTKVPSQLYHSLFCFSQKPKPHILPMSSLPKAPSHSPETPMTAGSFVSPPAPRKTPLLYLSLTKMCIPPTMLIRKYQHQWFKDKGTLKEKRLPGTSHPPLDAGREGWKDGIHMLNAGYTSSFPLLFPIGLESLHF